VSILLALVNLLLELLGLLVVCKRQSCHALLELKGVEKDAILVVTEAIIYFLIPNNSTVVGLRERQRCFRALS